MMRKIKLLALMVAVGSFFFFASFVLAQEATPTASGTEIYTPRLLPDNPLYFLKSWKERVELFLAQTPEAKAEKYTELATRRIAEAKMMIRKNKHQFVAKLMEKHDENLGKAKEKIKEAQEKGRDIERVLAIVAEATSQHLNILAEVYEKVPESAKSAIEKAIEVSSRGKERALEAISKEKGKSLRRHIEEKIEKEKPIIKKVLEKRLEESLKTKEGKEEKEECHCIPFWEPVCGMDGRTYTNDCYLECANAEKAYEGECLEKEMEGEKGPAKLEFEVGKGKPAKRE